jgi:hypothetical protein
MKSFKPIDNFGTTNTKYMYQLEKNKKHSTGTHKSTSWDPKPGRFWRCTTETTGCTVHRQINKLGKEPGTSGTCRFMRSKYLVSHHFVCCNAMI